MRTFDFVATLLLLSTTTSAWSSPWKALQHEIAPLVRRQDGQAGSTTSYNLQVTNKEGDIATMSSDSSTGDATSNGGSKTTAKGQSTGSGSSSGTAKQTGSSRTSDSGESTKTYDARLPAGGVSMITPNPMSTQYYKIRDHVTFAWNYTSLLAPPNYVDILASCTLNQETYTIAMNQSWSSTQTVVWDTGKYQATGTVPLLTETYTLIIHDAAKDVSAMPKAGYLGTANQLIFGMYIPQSYTPMADYVCATCSSAMTSMERQTVWAIFGMVGLTVLSFGWFSGVAGLW